MRNLLFLIVIALLSSCRGEKGKLLLTGELKGLRTADLLVWNAQGLGSGRIDTIHVASGRFDYEAPATDEVTAWTLVYPNGSVLTIFGASGDYIKMRGNANELKRVEVSGSPDNDLYTEFRLGRLSAADLLQQYPGTAVARQVASERPSGGAGDRVGQRLKDFCLVTADSDTIDLARLRGRDVIIGVWASWSVESRDMLRAMRMEKKKRGKQLEMISINVDISDDSRKVFERMDSITWHRVNSDAMFAYPLLDSLGILSVPYIVLLDTTGIVTAATADYKKHLTVTNADESALQSSRRR